MSRKFITTIVAGAIAITGFSTAQAQAGDRDLVRFLAGATALVIIGKALSDHDDRHKPKVITRGNGHHGYITHRHHSHGKLHRHRVGEPARHHAPKAQKRHKKREMHREVRREARREARREVRRQHSHVQPRPLPDRVRRYERRHLNR